MEVGQCYTTMLMGRWWWMKARVIGASPTDENAGMKVELDARTTTNVDVRWNAIAIKMVV